jgi:ATP-dependent DNA ligase
MAAASEREPFDSPDWIFETKLDGYRAMAVIDSTGTARHRPVSRYCRLINTGFGLSRIVEKEKNTAPGCEFGMWLGSATAIYLIS